MENKRKRIIVLGAGMVGSAIAMDLGKSYHKVILVDYNMDRLFEVEKQYNNYVTTSMNMQPFLLTCADISKKEELIEVINQFHNIDLIVSAVPGFLGFETVKTIIECGKNFVDISFCPENLLTLNDLAAQMKVVGVMDCGVAPGLDNILLGHCANNLEEVTDFECLVGGLPKIKKWPFNYKAPFSPIDVIEEYTRPARLVVNNEVVVREALSDCELIWIDRVGTLESFNSDGLRSLITSFPEIKNMKEKTLRYQGHSEYIRVLKESGFFDKKEIVINDVSISPLDFTSKILFNEWKLNKNEKEITVMKVTIRGIDKNDNNIIRTITYDLYDEFVLDEYGIGISSMARTTGYTATAMVNLILNNNWNTIGITAPENVGLSSTCVKYIFEHLKKRNITINKAESVNYVNNIID